MVRLRCYESDEGKPKSVYFEQDNCKASQDISIQLGKFLIHKKTRRNGCWYGCHFESLTIVNKGREKEERK